MPLQPRSSRYFFAVANLLAHGALYGALRHSLRAPPHRSIPPLNLHRARVRRNRGRLPSSRCIESAQTHRACACALPARASDTTLGLIGIQGQPCTDAFLISSIASNFLTAQGFSTP
jgi:hypothetical protein